jgi:FkbM family methyltransferase
VWDIGANVGFFTRQLAEHVGESGCVVAFEPFKSTFDRLLSETNRLPQVRCLQLALGADERDLFVNGIPERPSNTLLNEVMPGAGEKIHVTTGTKLIRDGQPQPNVIKIDVEGFEEDVLWGFRESLRDSCCTTILIEIHYSLSEKRGFLRAPDRVLSLLRDAGFRTRWLDPGHLKASRPPRKLPDSERLLA